MQIIRREGKNSWEAFQIAQAMEDAGASVFSIVHEVIYHTTGTMSRLKRLRRGFAYAFGQLFKNEADWVPVIASSSFVVYAKFEEPVTSVLIDKAILEEFKLFETGVQIAMASQDQDGE